MAQIIEFLAFIELRRSHDSMPRPYRIPVNYAGAIALMMLPMIFVGIIFIISSLKTIVLAFAGAGIGVVAYYFLEIARVREWCDFEPLRDETYLPISLDDSVPSVKRPNETSKLLSRVIPESAIS